MAYQKQSEELKGGAMKSLKHATDIDDILGDLEHTPRKIVLIEI